MKLVLHFQIWLLLCSIHYNFDFLTQFQILEIIFYFWNNFRFFCSFFYSCLAIPYFYYVLFINAVIYFTTIFLLVSALYGHGEKYILGSYAKYGIYLVSVLCGIVSLVFLYVGVAAYLTIVDMHEQMNLKLDFKLLFRLIFTTVSITTIFCLLRGNHFITTIWRLILIIFLILSIKKEALIIFFTVSVMDHNSNEVR